MKIEAGIKLPNGKVITTTMSDIKWDLLCLTDRLFHPEKYGGNAEGTITKICQRLKLGKSEEQIVSINEFVENVRRIPKEKQEEAEQSIRRQIAEIA